MRCVHVHYRKLGPESVANCGQSNIPETMPHGLVPKLADLTPI